MRDWEVWNEPNAGLRFWLPTARGDAPAFGRLVARARGAVVAADPLARVAFGGTVFLPQLIPGGVAFTREAFAANPGLASMLAASGYDVTRPLWITETGWPVTADVPEERQARYLVRTVLLSALAGVDGVWLYELGDGNGRGDLVPEDLFGVYRYDADTADAVDPRPKPSATALRALFATLGAFRVTGGEAVPGAPDDAYVLARRDLAGRRAWAAWRADDGAPPWRWSPPARATALVNTQGQTVAREADGVSVGGAPVDARAP